MKSLHNLNKSWSNVKHDDFFPYSDVPDAFWTSFYTSRPRINYYINYANNILRIIKQLIVMTDIYSDASYWVKSLQESVDLTTHHDAITGKKSIVKTVKFLQSIKFNNKYYIKFNVKH